MIQFKEIIKLRNKGYTQQEIAEALGISRRSVIRYLNKGKLPIYERTKETKKDPFEKFEAKTKELLKRRINGGPPNCKQIYRELQKEGYRGSLRTIERKTEELRASLKERSIYFEQEVPEGECIEGDFTEIVVPFKSGDEKRYLWVMALKKSKGTFAQSFPNQTFEAFAEGTVKGFESFCGVPKTYRLDNLKPVVIKILKKGRKTTDKFDKLKGYYKFEASFCRPGKGNDKGTVEAINKHFKNHLSWEIANSGKKFEDDCDFDDFLSKALQSYNLPKNEAISKEKETLSPLPKKSFSYFRLELVPVSKYGFVKVAGKRYSVPSIYKLRTVEARLTSYTLSIFLKGEKIKEHPRDTSRGSKKVSIDFLDHIDEMLKKPGAFTHYKHQETFFPTPIYKRFYEECLDNRTYLKSLSLCKEHSISEVELAMMLCMEENCDLSYEMISDLLSSGNSKRELSVFDFPPLKPQLKPYDNLLCQI